MGLQELIRHLVPEGKHVDFRYGDQWLNAESVTVTDAGDVVIELEARDLEATG